MRKEASQVRSRHGFTLIELLIVVAILAMLIAILMPALSQARHHGRRIRCGSTLRAFGCALDYAKAQTGRYPEYRRPTRYGALDNIGPDIANELVSGALGDPRAMYCPTSIEDDPTAGGPFAPAGIDSPSGRPWMSWEAGQISYMYLAGIRYAYPDQANGNQPTFNPDLESPDSTKRARNVLAGDRTVDIHARYQRYPGLRRSNHGERGGWFFFTTGDAAWFPRHALTRHPLADDVFYCDWLWPGPS